MKNKWTQNWGLKIGSFVFAILLWMIVTNIDDPVTSQYYDNVQVRLTHTDILEESQKVYEVLDDTDIIDRVTVWAPRSVLEDITFNNIVATADINDLSSLDTISIDLDINNVSDTSISNITTSSDIVKLKIENRKSKTVMIKSIASGELPEGYMTGDISPDQNAVRITGPESLVDSVVSATADIDISQFTDVAQLTGDVNTDVSVRLLDAEGSEVHSERITKNIEAVGVRIPILQLKEVPVVYAPTGEPMNGYQATGVEEISRGSLLVAGRRSVINSFETIIIPEEELDITGRTEDLIKNLDLADYLPDGIRLANNESSTATITIYIEPEVTRSVTIQENRVRIVNMPEGFKGSFTGMEEGVTVTLVGLRSHLDQIRTAEITGEIDIAVLMADRGMDSMEVGFYTSEVELNLGNNVSVLEPIEVLLNITLLEG